MHDPTWTDAYLGPRYAGSDYSELDGSDAEHARACLANDPFCVLSEAICDCADADCEALIAALTDDDDTELGRLVRRLVLAHARHVTRDALARWQDAAPRRQREARDEARLCEFDD